MVSASTLGRLTSLRRLVVRELLTGLLTRSVALLQLTELPLTVLRNYLLPNRASPTSTLWLVLEWEVATKRELTPPAADVSTGTRKDSLYLALLWLRDASPRTPYGMPESKAPLNG